MVEDLNVWGSGYRGILEERDTGTALASVCVGIPSVPAGLCKPVYEAVAWYEKLAKWIHVFPRKTVLGRDTQGCSRVIGSQKILNVRVKFRAV